jgi:hypothetical protein
MIAAEREQFRPRTNDLRRLRLDRARHVGHATVVDAAVAPIDDRQLLKWIETERILRVAIEDRRRAADRLRPETRTRPIRSRGIEGHAPHGNIHAFEIARVATAHE